MKKTVRTTVILSAVVMLFNLTAGADQASVTESMDVSDKALVQLAAALNEGSRFSRFNKLYTVIDQLSGEDLVAVINDLGTLPENEERMEVRDLLYLRWGEIDSHAALSHICKNSSASDNVLGQNGLVEKLIDQWARNDLKAATSYVEGHAFSEILGLKEILLTRIALVWAETDAEAATQWFGETCAGKAAGEGLNRIVSQLALTEPSKAAEIIEFVPNGYVRHWAVGNLMTAWVKKDLPAARAWAEALPVGNKRQTAFIIFIRHWLKQDSDAAGKYVLSLLPEDGFRNAMIREFAYQCAHNDPEGVLEWQENVPDEALRKTIRSDVRIVWSDNAQKQL
jgi:hypothetical protein